MHGLLKGVVNLIYAIPVLLVLCAAGFIGVVVTAASFAAHFIALGLAILTGVAYCIWEAFQKKPKDTDRK